MESTVVAQGKLMVGLQNVDVWSGPSIDSGYYKADRRKNPEEDNRPIKQRTFLADTTILNKIK